MRGTRRGVCARECSLRWPVLVSRARAQWLVWHTLIARARRSSFKSSAATRPSGRPSTHHSDRHNLLRRCRPYRGRANREPRATAPPAPATARWLLHVCRNTVTAAGVLLSCVQLVRRTRRAFAPSLRLPRVSGRCAGCVAPRRRNRRRSGVALAAVAGKNQDSKIHLHLDSASPAAELHCSG